MQQIADAGRKRGKTLDERGRQEIETKMEKMG